MHFIIQSNCVGTCRDIECSDNRVLAFLCAKLLFFSFVRISKATMKKKIEVQCNFVKLYR